MYYTKLNSICQYIIKGSFYAVFALIVAMPLYAFGQSGQSDAPPRDAGNGKFFYNSDLEQSGSDPFSNVTGKPYKRDVAPTEAPDPLRATEPSSENKNAIQGVEDEILNKIKPQIKTKTQKALSALLKVKKEAADKIDKEKIEALSQAILYKKDKEGNDIYKTEAERIKRVFDTIRAEVNAIINEEFDKSCTRIRTRIRTASPTIDIVKEGEKISEEESAQAKKDAKCSIDEINKIATVYITKRLAATTITDKMSFIAGEDGKGGKLKEVGENIKNIDAIIADLADDTYFLEIGEKIGNNSIKVLSDINNQLRLIHKNLLEIHNGELRRIKKGIVDNTIKKEEVEAAFNKITKKLGAIQNSIDSISNDLNSDSQESRDLRTGAKSKDINLLEYRKLIVNLKEEIVKQIESVEKLANSENINKLYKVLDNKEINIRDPFTLSPRKPNSRPSPPPVTTPSPGGPMTVDIPDMTDAEIQRAKEAALRESRQRVIDLKKQRDDLRKQLQQK